VRVRDYFTRSGVQISCGQGYNLICMCSVECEAHVKQTFVSSIVRSSSEESINCHCALQEQKREENWYVDELVYQSL